MKCKKLLTALLCAALLLSLTACKSGGGQNTSSGAADTVTIWAWDDNFNVKAANLAKEY